MGFCKYCYIAYKSLKAPPYICGYCKIKKRSCNNCGVVQNRKSLNKIDHEKYLCLQCYDPQNICIRCKRNFIIELNNGFCGTCLKSVFPIQFPGKLVTLNNDQAQLIKHSLDKHATLLACAGSGKTTTIVAKIAYMILYQGVQPESIILTTFTKNAAKEMKERLLLLLGVEDLPIITGTFHSVSIQLLKKYDPDRIGRLFHIDELQYNFNTFLEEYDLGKLGIKYLFVDEYQDINEIQYQIISKFVNSGSTLVGVGDDGQNIYTFRGSHVKYILEFQTLFPGSSRYMLSRNYRSNKFIIDIANKSISKNPNQHPKNMISHKIGSIKPQVKHFDSMYKEVEWIVEDILSSKIPFDEIAVLTRNGSPLYFIEESLAKLGVYSLLLMGKNIQTEKKEGLVTLSTIHSSKGLEWKRVYLMGFNDQFFPSDKTQIEEERRLFYVAVTRCKDDLFVSYSGKRKYLSRFVVEVGRRYFDYEGTKFELSDDSEIERENSVTGYVNSLDGEDYCKMRELGIIWDFNFDQQSVHKKYKYAGFIDKRNIYTEFGIFIDYYLRRLTGSYSDKKAMKIIETLSLGKKDYPEFLSLYDKIKNFDVNQLNEFNKNNKMWIKRIIWKMNKFAYKKVIDVIIDTKFHLPFEFMKKMENSYVNYKNRSLKSRSIIKDIYNVSKCHSIAFMRKAVLYKKVKKRELGLYKGMYDSMELFIERMIKGASSMERSPSFNTDEILGEGDLLIDDLLIDFKVSSGSALEMNNVVQLLCYVAMGRSLGYEINRIGLYNPLLGEYSECDISGWNKERELVKYLISVR